MTTPAAPPPDSNRPSGPFKPASFSDNPTFPATATPHDAPVTFGEGPAIGLGEVPANIITGPGGSVSRD